ncbi:MAG: hypothetical protein MUQ25_14090 [Candidatus Aminicenantes bacterium]|nr:hypothetical protein [Candidatus Aminicenantes bacterium]
MKKVIVMVSVLVLVAGLGSRPAFAQDKKAEFSFNLGVMTYLESAGSFSGALFTITPQVDIHVTKGFMISPEAMFLTDFHFSGVIGLPGVILNYTGDGFFIGAGVVVPVAISEGDAGVGNILPKLNIGYRGRHVNLTAYLITDIKRIFSDNLVGASLGYRF